MTKRSSSTLVILTRNEIEGSQALFNKIPISTVDECLVIDGGSKDGTAEFFRENGVRVVEQTILGRGEAFRIAVRETKSDYLIFFSPDGNEDPEDIPRLLSKLEDGHDMVIASRFLPNSRNEEDDLLLPWRAWANRAFTLIANTLWHGNLSDSINGFRAIRRDVFMQLNPDGPGYVIEYQLSIRAMKLGLKIAEIPTIEGQRIGGESGAPSIPTGILFLKFLVRELTVGRAF